MTDNLILLRKVADGDAAALDALVASNMGLVRCCASRFLGRGAEYEDLVQIGSIGLLRAARSFDPDHGCMFSTYAVPLIIGEIKRFLRDDGLIKVSRTLKSAGMNVMKQKELFLKQEGREPTLSEIASLCGIGVDEVVAALEATGPISSLSEPMGEDDATLETFLSSSPDPMENVTDRIALYEAIRALSPRRQKIVFLRFFKDLSQSDTGKILGITQVKVSREEKAILEELRRLL